MNREDIPDCRWPILDISSNELRTCYRPANEGELCAQHERLLQQETEWLLDSSHFTSKLIRRAKEDELRAVHLQRELNITIRALADRGVEYRDPDARFKAMMSRAFEKTQHTDRKTKYAVGDPVIYSGRSGVIERVTLGAYAVRIPHMALVVGIPEHELYRAEGEQTKLLADSVQLSNKYCPRYYTGAHCTCPKGSSPHDLQGRCWYDEQKARRAKGLLMIDANFWPPEEIES